MNCAGLVKYENHTHVKKMGHTLELLFGIYWWTWKTTIKKMLKWTNKNCKNFNIYSVAKKTPGDIIILHLCTKNLDMIYGSWYRVWPTDNGNYESLFALLHPLLKTQKIKRKNNCWRYHHFTKVYQKPQSYEVWLRHNETDKKFCYLGPFFTLLTS